MPVSPRRIMKENISRSKVLWGSIIVLFNAMLCLQLRAQPINFSNATVISGETTRLAAANSEWLLAYIKAHCA
jgi:hypothetical protein